ncbi:EAL domain-containing protein [Alteromonas facilis]|uniref:EAL domain-containing protein n=1 Tax=Alteromonas facilis TaxID=2048004 RepID=UPI000C287C68|nr:EAL domain-containing protein [Alteromonas facilis]
MSITPNALKTAIQRCLFSLMVCIVLLPISVSASNDIVHDIQIDSLHTTTDIVAHAESLRTDSYKRLSEIQLLDGWSAAWNSEPLQEEQSLWIRTRVNNQSTALQTLYLSIADPTLDVVDIFVIDELGRIVASHLMGADKDFELRPISHRNFIAPISLSGNASVTVYIKISDEGPLLMPITLKDAEAWVLEQQNMQVLFGIFVGALTVFTLYFLTTYLILKSPVRFWFSLTCFVLMLFILNVHGFIGQITHITEHSGLFSAIFLTLLMGLMGKVCTSLFVRTSAIIKYLALFLPIGILLNAFLTPEIWIVAVNSIIVVGCVVIQCVMALQYYFRLSSRPGFIFVIGWLFISLAAGLNLYLYEYLGDIDALSTLLIILFVTMGVLTVGVSIEINQQVLMRLEQTRQEKRIDSLSQFYQLFRNSAEGLYTSTTDGILLSVNPAMWQLFGYESEDEMLSSIQSTDEFYADKSDRDVLIGELRTNKTVLGREFRGLRKDGSEFWFSLSCQLHNDGDQTFLYGSLFDVTERKQSNISLEYLATHDSLTGVNNRREFERQLQYQLSQPFNADQPMILLYMDLDQFKVVNDTCGHKAGDALLQQLARLLDEGVGERGLLARLGGDEFGVLLTNSDNDEAYVLANRLLNIVSDFRFMWENNVFSLGISIGLVERTEKIDSPEQMMSMADAACYIAKEQGRNQIHRYSLNDITTKRYESELNWLAHINEALEQNNFQLYYQHYQPLHKMSDGHRYEILLRMQTSDGELVPPGAFLPAAERYSLGAKIDRWVIHNYFAWLNQNPEHMTALRKSNINLCGQSLADRDFKLYVLNAFEKFSIPYDKVCFEITEGMAIIKMDETLEFIKTFSQLGCKFALDDFGSGFSSYGYLKQLPVQYVKIDGAFVRDLLSDPIDLAMVRSINDVAKAIGMETVAEFVENSEIKMQLGKMGVDYAQGYGISMPAPLDEYAPFGD